LEVQENHHIKNLDCKEVGATLKAGTSYSEESLNLIYRSRRRDPIYGQIPVLDSKTLLALLRHL